jgi:GNAT superfamily N-acetyltransferase
MIRQFTPGDASSCCTLIHACLDHDASYPPALREKIKRLETPGAMIERARLFYIAVYESGGQVVGLAGLDLNEIRLLCISPKYQRKGIGRVLLEHVRSMVPPALFADVFVYSSEQAADFYRVCGFAEKGPFIFNVEGEPLRAVFMTSPIHFERVLCSRSLNE